MAKILIIDDDPDIAESTKVVLESVGHKVIIAPNGEDGLSKISENPDMIILDVMMPEMDGFEVSRQVKDKSKGKKIPILMLTAIKDKMGLDFKEASGDETWLPVDDYCEKPIEKADLLSKVEKLLSQK